MRQTIFLALAALLASASLSPAQVTDTTDTQGATTAVTAADATTTETDAAADTTSALPATVVQSEARIDDRAPIQTIPQATGSTLEPGPTALGDVLETAPVQRVGANLLPEVGMSVLRIRRPEDVVRYLPNQSATNSGTRSFGDVYSVRGLTNTVFFGAPSVTVYVDDVPFGEVFSYAQDFGPINSIEVLRGPRPTAVGRNVYGGLINVRSRKPGDVFESTVRYDSSSFETRDLDATIMGPINDKLGFRIGGGVDQSDGFLIDTNTGRPVDHQSHAGVHGGLFYTPAPGWEISLTASYDEFDDGAPRITALNRNTGFYTVSSNVVGEQFRTQNHQALRIGHEEGHRRFLSVTSHRGFELDPFTADLDFTAAPGGFTTLQQSQDIWSQEFRWSEDDPNSAWAWNAGLYGSTSRIQGWGFRRFLIPPGPFSSDQVTVHTIDEDAFAAFAGVEHRPNEEVSIHAGGRIDYVKRAMVRDKTQTIIPPAVVPRINLEEDWVHFTPTLGVDWQATENNLLFARTTYAFKPGGFSAYADNLALVPFDDETVWATEVGVRNDSFDGRVDSQLVFFYNAVNDYQVERNLAGTDYAVLNADEAETYGLEFETTVEICSSLDFYGSLGWTHARLTRYIDPVTGRVLDGVIPPFVPEFDAVAALDYHLDCGFFARLELLATGDTVFDDFNRAPFRQDAFALLNALVGWRTPDWSVALYGANLTDEGYYTNMNPAVRTGAVGTPQEFGVRFEWTPQPQQ